MKSRLIIGLVINIIIFALEIYCLVIFINSLLSADPDNRFIYYTNISNLSLGVICCITSVFLSFSIAKKELIYPKVFSIIKFVVLAMTTLTFFVVLFAFPFRGYDQCYSKIRMITHLIVPVLGYLSYLFFEDNKLFERKYSLFANIPAFCYSIAYGTFVALLNWWPDIYTINTNGFWYLFALLAIFLGFIFSQGMYFIKKIYLKKHNTV